MTNNKSLLKPWFHAEIYDEKVSEEVISAHWWWYEVWINMERDYWEFALIRKNLNEK
jgi:hypothetical protein